jgi:hypothetical protein
VTIHDEQPYIRGGVPQTTVHDRRLLNFYLTRTKDGRAEKVDIDEPGASKRLTFSANAKPGKEKQQQI